MFKIKMRFRDLKDLNLIDVSSVSKGYIRVKNPQLLVLGSNQWKYVTLPFKLETVCEDFHSVAFLIADKDLRVRNSISYTYNSIDKVFYGSYEVVKTRITNNSINIVRIDVNEELFLLRFCTKRFYDEINNKTSKGLQSSPIELEIYIGDKLIPTSTEQALSHGLELIKDDKIWYNKVYK